MSYLENTKIVNKMLKNNTLLGMELFSDTIKESLIFHIPHSQTKIPKKYLSDYFNDNMVENEIKLLTDFSTDKIFNIGSVDTIIFPYSRVFCDVERLEDEHEVMFEKGRGFYYTKTDGGQELRLTNNKKVIHKNYYKKHHNSFNKLVDNKLKNNGFVTIIDCHSYSDLPFKTDLEQSAKRPDFCLGTDDYHTPKWLVDSLYNHLTKNGYKVEINYPYKGTIVPLKHYKTTANVNSIMIEVNRKLYMEDSIVNEDKVIALNTLLKEFFQNHY